MRRNNNNNNNNRSIKSNNNNNNNNRSSKSNNNKVQGVYVDPYYPGAFTGNKLLREMFQRAYQRSRARKDTLPEEFKWSLHQVATLYRMFMAGYAPSIRIGRRNDYLDKKFAPKGPWVPKSVVELYQYPDRLLYRYQVENAMRNMAVRAINTFPDIRAEYDRGKQNAATKIQAAVRGHLSRKRYPALPNQRSAVTKIQAAARGHLARKRYQALLNQYRAATKIQAAVRGRQARNRYPALLNQYYAPGGRGAAAAVQHAMMLART